MKLTSEQRNIRDMILFESPYDEKKYWLGGIRKFVVPAYKIRSLVWDGLVDRAECQNDGPTIEEFLDYDSRHPGENLLLGGYAVKATREDERVTIDSIQFVGGHNLTPEAICFIEEFHWADEINFYEDGETVTIEAWWD